MDVGYKKEFILTGPVGERSFTLKSNIEDLKKVVGDLSSRKLARINLCKRKSLILENSLLSVSHVIYYDMPQNYNDYIHRIGRTGRAGKKVKPLHMNLIY